MEASSNEELQEIYLADQRVRQELHEGGLIAVELFEGERRRRQRVEQLIASGEVRTADDHFHAAMVFQHGGTVEHCRQAQELAVKAVDLGHHAESRWWSAAWLAAAAEDRGLMLQGRPQRYGTQFVIEEGVQLLWEVDPATTDEERAAWRVPPLADALARAEGRVRRADR